MAERNDVQVEYDALGKAMGMTKQSGSWYSIHDDVITQINLQKSDYGLSYYLNVGWWLRTLGGAQFPKERELHVRIRLDALIPGRADDVKTLLDIEQPVDGRSVRLRELFQELPEILAGASSVEGLRTLWHEGRLQAAVVRSPAIRVLDEAASP